MRKTSNQRTSLAGGGALRKPDVFKPKLMTCPEKETGAEKTGLHFLFISVKLLYTALCTRYFLREGMDVLWAEIRWI